MGGGGGDPLVLGGSLCSEYLALQPQEQEDCETVMEEKCSSQDTTHCFTQYVKVTTQLSLPVRPVVSSSLSGKG